jgi:hypothetical protein
MEGRDAAKEASRGVFFSISFDRQSHLRRRLIAPIPKHACGISPCNKRAGKWSAQLSYLWRP